MRKILLLVIGVLTASLVVAFFVLNSYRSRASFNDNRYKGLINTLTATPIPKSFLSSDNAFLTSVVYTQPHGAYGRAWHYLDERRLDEDMERIKALGFDGVIYWGVNLQSVWKIDYDKLKNQAPYPTYFQVNETELGKLIHFMDAAAKYNLKVNLLLMGGYEEPLKPDPQQPSDWGGKAPGAAIVILSSVFDERSQ